MSEAERIAAFWDWWRRHAASIAATIDAGNANDLDSELSPRVHALDPDLQWELTPGRSARHALVVSSGGSAELRPLAERWARAAPPGATWEYYPARIADLRS